MGKLDLFNIVFTNPHGVCKAGDLLTGYVTVHLNEKMKMRGVFVTFKGTGHVHFVKNRGSKNAKTCKATEQYFEDQYALFRPPPDEGTDGGYLQEGQHKFDFQYQLNVALPSTFEGECGYVRYYVKCKLDRPWKFDHTVKEPFTVLSVLDLNRESGAENPIFGEDKRQDTTCCCCDNGDASLTMNIPRCGFVPGESIPISAEIKNQTSDPLDVTVQLVQYITYYARGRTKEQKEIVSTLPDVSVQPRTTHAYNREKLPIPAIPPSRLVGCDIINIQYTLKINASSGFFECKLRGEILIGTIPLRSVVDMYRTPPLPDLNAIRLEPSAPVPPPADEYRPSPLPADFDMPPPSYEQCVFGMTNVRDEDDTEHTMGAMNYVPKYTYYNWN